MLTFVKFILLFIILFGEALVINNVTLKLDNKLNRIFTTAITVFVTMGLIAWLFTWGVNYIPFGQ